MKDVDDETKRLARSSLIWYGLGLACGIVLAVFLVGNTIRMIVYPVRAATESAVAIGAGNLDQVVPITSDDELGQLASAFNTMARQLREFRQSHKAQLIRAQRTSQATIDSFPEPVLVVDPEDRVEMANPAARRLFGLPHPEHAGAAPPVWEPPEALRQPLAEALHEQRAYVPEGFDKVIVLQHGEQPHSYLPRVLPIRDASSVTLGAAVLLEDVTRFRLLDEVKSNMVATVSHELKTPLTSIRLVLHLLLQEDVGPLLPKQLELLVDARDNAERLLGHDQQPLGPGPLGARRQPASRAPGVARDACCGRRSMPSSRGPQTAAWSSCWKTRALPSKCRSTRSSCSTPCRTCWKTPWPTRPPGGRITLAAEARSRPCCLLGDGHRLGHSGRISAFDFPKALSRARRRDSGRERPGAGDCPRNRHGPRRSRRLRKQPRGEDRLPHVAAHDTTHRKLERLGARSRAMPIDDKPPIPSGSWT